MVNNDHNVDDSRHNLRHFASPQPYHDDVDADDEENESRPLMTDTQRHDADAGAAGDAEEAVTRANSDIPTTTAARPNRSLGTADHGHPDAPLDAPLDDSSTLEVGDESDPPTPRFMQDESASKRWKRVPYPVRRLCVAVARWSHGPPDARPYHVRPLLPIVQEYPLWLVERFLPRFKQRAWVLLFYFSIWLITFVLVKRQGVQSEKIPGWGEPQDIGCGTTYWGKDNSCGVDGNDCRPFTASGFPFRCPAKCESYHVLNPRAVGAQEIVYSTFVIGGGPSSNTSQPPTYRGDSFICQAALHSGVISNEHGGCGVVELTGVQNYFTGNKSNGITSITFDSTFPQSFQFVNDIKCSAQDTRWSLLAVTVVFTTMLSLFTASPALFFFPIFVGIFWTVGMATDAPTYASVAALFSNILGRFLPAMFCAWVIFDKMGVRRTLTGLTAQIEKTVLWLGPCWVGALTNYTFDFIPIQRLNKHDLDQQPGARAALAMIIIVLACIVGSQVWFFRQEARFLKYIKLYALFIFGIIISLLLPGVDLRIHHYILALLLLPGTSMQTRPSLVYQGLLIGFFINGIARWGFDSVLQTPAALQGDAPSGTELPIIPTPNIDMANSTDELSTIAFNWKQPTSVEFDGISILVNDVERFRSYFEDTIDPQDKFVWTRNGTGDDSSTDPEYFRFAYMDGSESGDYTKAGTWTAEGKWVEMKPGPSRLRVRSADRDDILRRR